jgi:hypothetical protein
MGTVLTGYGDAGYDHEGYAAQVLDDNSITGTYSDTTKPRMIGQVVAACDCGWTGKTRYPITTRPFDQDAEQLALTEWEHTHARPTLRRLQQRSPPGSAGTYADSPGTSINWRPTRSRLSRALPTLTCSTRC